jgi:hypothetical protein
MSKGSLGKANCGVSSMRKRSPPLILKTLPYWSQDASTIQTQSLNIFRRRISTLRAVSWISSTMRSPAAVVEWYINDPLTALNRPPMVPFAQIGLLDTKVFEQRFSLLWNTLWKISVEYNSLSWAGT